MYFLQVKHIVTMFGLRMYSCSLFEQFSNPICVSWSRPDVVYDRPCLHLRTNLVHLRTNLGPRIAFWGPDLGPCFGFHF